MKPIAIEVRGMLLDFEGSLRFKLLNPMFQQDAIPGISVFPFNLVGSPNNKRLLGYFNLAEDALYQNSVDANLYLYGNLWMKGQLKYKWTKDSFECTFSQVMKLYDNKDKLLTQLSYTHYDFANQDGYYLLYNDLKARSLDGYAGVKDYVYFPQYNPSFFNNKAVLQATPPGPYTSPYDTLLPGQYHQYLNYWDYRDLPGGYYLKDFFHVNRGAMPRVNEYTMSPSFYVDYLLKKLMEYNDFTTIDSPDFLDVDDIDQLVITSDKFFRMRVEQRFISSVLSWVPQFLDWPDFIFKPEQYLPDITMLNFLNGLKKTFNLSYFFGLIDGKVEIRHNQTLLANPAYEDWTHKCFLLHDKEYSTVDGITFKYANSDDTVINTETKSIRGRNILTPVGSIGSLPTPTTRGDLCLVVYENAYYETEYGSGSSLVWKFYGYAPASYKESGAEEYESGTDTWHTAVQTDVIEPLLQATTTAPAPYTYKKWRLPIGDAPGNGDFFGLNKKSQSYMRLLFYRGMDLYTDHENYYLPGASDPIYPYANCDEYSSMSSDVYNLSLLWNGSKGLYSKWWSAWVEYRKKRVPIKRAVLFTMNDLLGFDYKKKRMIDNVKYFVNEGDLVISTKKGIEPAVIEFLKSE